MPGGSESVAASAYTEMICFGSCVPIAASHGRSAAEKLAPPEDATSCCCSRSCFIASGQGCTRSL
eukprot:4924298-Pleurochrysis_carterae.AAC.1